jgi:hypothetical protein
MRPRDPAHRPRHRRGCRCEDAASAVGAYAVAALRARTSPVSKVGKAGAYRAMPEMRRDPGRHDAPQDPRQLLSVMQRFKYRFYDLEMEHCPNEHGYWLEADLKR